MDVLGKLAKYLESVTGADYRILARVPGAAAEVLIFSSHKSLAAWEAAALKVATDPKAQEMTAAAVAAGLFVPGSAENALWQDA